MALGCNDDHKAILTSFVLQGEANHWWDAKARFLRARLKDVPIT